MEGAGGGGSSLEAGAAKKPERWVTSLRLSVPLLLVAPHLVEDRYVRAGPLG